MKKLISISLILSLCSGVLNNIINLPNNFSITIVPIIIIFFLGTIFAVKKNYIENCTPIYIILYFMILIIFISSYSGGMNFSVIKTIMYVLIIFFLINNLKEKSIENLFKIVAIISLIFALDSFVAAAKIMSMGMDLINVRSFTLMDKSYYNVLYNVAIPISILSLIIKRKLVYLLTSICFIVSGIFILQIKTLLLSVALSLVAVIFIYKLVNRMKMMVFIISISLGISLSFALFSDYLPKQIVISVNYMLGNQMSEMDARYTETNMLREAINKHCIELIKENPLFGIGFGNYASTIDQVSFRLKVGGRLVDSLPEVTENGFLSMLIDGGIFYFSLHILIFIYISVRFYRTRLESRSLIKIISVCIYYSIFLSNAVQDNIYSYPYWFFISAAIFTLKSEKKESKPSPQIMPLYKVGKTVII
ncbi:O-antigen ligase family protein [Paenibacillus sp. D51F]